MSEVGATGAAPGLPGPAAGRVVDLRLVPVVVVALATAWVGTGPGEQTTGPSTLAGAVAVGALGAVALVVRRRTAPGAHVLLAHLLLALACATAVCAGIHVQSARQEPLASAAAAGSLATLTGTVVTSARPATFGVGERWTIRVDGVEARGAVSSTAGLVEVTAPGAAPRFGARVTVRGVLRASERGTGDELLARTSVGAPVVEDAPPGRVLALTDRMRQGLLDVTDKLSDQARGLVPGVTVGDTSRLSPDLDAAMRTTSLTHMTAVSGGHFAIVVAALVAVCTVLRLPRPVRVTVVAVAATAFVLLVRPEPSVLRAAWTCAVGLLGLCLGRPAAGMPALGAAATVLLVVDPWLARSYGFVLSCAATAGLVLLAGPLARRLAPWTGRTLGFGLAVPWAAQAACGPVLVLLTPRIPLASVAANLLAAPALVPATVLGLVATLIAPWAPGLASPLTWLAGLATGWIALVARQLARVPTMPWPGGVGGALLLAAATAALLAVVLRFPPAEGWSGAWQDRRVRLARARARARARRRAGGHPGSVPALLIGGAALVAVGLVVAVPRVVSLPGPAGAPADWSVVACDVGQGDSLVLRSGTDSAVVVDAGPAGDAAGGCLDRLGVTRIDLLVLTHFHADHVGGLPGVLDGRAVSSALVTSVDVPAAGAAAATAQLAEAGVPVRVARPGDAGSAGTLSWRVLGAGRQAGSAADADGAEGDAANDASVATWLHTADGVDVAALGDLEKDAQEALYRTLTATGQAADVDIVKMAHHGSRSQSADLARWLSPQVALVSVGKDNTYGHPTDEALDLYAGLGAAVVRTDECGTAALVVRGGSLGLVCD